MMDPGTVLFQARSMPSGLQGRRQDGDGLFQSVVRTPTEEEVTVRFRATSTKDNSEEIS